MNKIEPKSFDLDTENFIERFISYAAQRCDAYGIKWPGWIGYYHMFWINLLKLKDVQLAYNECFIEIDTATSEL